MGTLQPIVKYPLDLTGKSPDNLIPDEIHTLLPGVNRSLIPKYGAFYTTFNMGLRDMATGQVLVPETQYKPILYYAAASERSGKEVCAGVIVTDPTVSDQVAFTYQVVGGEYTHLTNIILELIENLELDNREVLWGDLLGKPNFFTPAMHLHDAGDIYGFEYIVEAIYRLRDAVLIGDEASHEHIFHLIDALRELVIDNHDVGTAFTQETLDRLIAFENQTAINFTNASNFTQQTLDRLITHEDQTANNFTQANTFTQQTLDRLIAHENYTTTKVSELNQFDQDTLNRLIAFETKLNKVDNYSHAYYDNRFVNATGDNMTGSIVYSNIDAGGWARGLEGHSGGSLAAGIGIHGSGVAVDSAYIGVGSSPWATGTGIRVSSGAVRLEGILDLDNANRVTTDTTGVKFNKTVTANNFVGGALDLLSGRARRLETARSINGASFDGTANITTPHWGVGRNITIGNTAKAVNGGSNVSWSLAEIGAAARTTSVSVGNGLVGGGNLTANRTITMGTPGTITATSTNTTTSNSHTHAIATASTAAAGVVRLNDAVTSTSTTQAATANAVKKANDNANTRALSSVTIAAGTGLNGGGNLTTNRTLSVKYGTTAGTAAQGNDSRIVNSVRTSGNQTVAGIKTFSSFPVTPSAAPTANYQVANKKYVDDKSASSSSIGVGQTWQNVAGSRTGTTWYTNSTGRAIQVACYTERNNMRFQVRQNANTGIVSLSSLYGKSNERAQLPFIIPPGWQYRLDSSKSSSYFYWVELR